MRINQIKSGRTQRKRVKKIQYGERTVVRHQRPTLTEGRTRYRVRKRVNGKKIAVVTRRRPN